MEINEYINSDDALFHYTKVSVAIESILFTKKLKPSLLKDTNDPREYKFKLFSIVSDGLGYDKLTKFLTETNPIIDRILRFESKVLCFCSNKKPTLILNDDNRVEDEYTCSKGWNKSRMWSQYGENHRGICLVFSKEGLEKELKTKRPQIVNYKSGYVQYSQKDIMAWEATTFDGNRLNKDGAEDYSIKHIMENSEELFYRKHIDYRDEAEYRTVVFGPHRTLDYLDISSSIKGVIAGDRTPEAYFPLIKQLCGELQIESRRLFWDKGGSSLLSL